MTTLSPLAQRGQPSERASASLMGSGDYSVAGADSSTYPSDGGQVADGPHLPLKI